MNGSWELNRQRNLKEVIAMDLLENNFIIKE